MISAKLLAVCALLVAGCESVAGTAGVSLSINIGDLEKIVTIAVTRISEAAFAALTEIYNVAKATLTKEAKRHFIVETSLAESMVLRPEHSGNGQPVTAALSAVNKIIQTAIALIYNLVQAVITLLNKIVNAIRMLQANGQLDTTAVEEINKVIQAINTIINKLIQTVSAVLKKITQTVIAALKKIVKAISILPVATAEDEIKKILEELNTELKKITEALLTVLDKIYNAIICLIKKATSATTASPDLVAKIVNGVIKLLDAVISIVNGTVQNVGDSLEGALGPLISVLDKILGDDLGPLIGDVDKTLGDLAAILAGIFKPITL